MGCGASKTAESSRERSEQSRDKAPPKGKSKSPAPARQREDSTDKYRHEKEGEKEAEDKGTPGAPKEEGTTLTVNMIADLRTKASKEAGSSVMRWIDCIVEPQDSDNPDLFDPMRRHVLSMESVNVKLQTAIREGSR